MNQNPIDRTRFEVIEAYVIGNMEAAERGAFEREIAHDAALRAEVELQRENMLAVELGGMERMLKTLGAEHESSSMKQGNGWSQYLKHAAVVAIVLSGALWMLSRRSKNERLFTEHFTADPGLPVAMSATNDHAFQDAMVAYKLGDYVEARSKWSAQLRSEPTNDTLRYYIASSALAMGDAAAAVPLFQDLSADQGSVFHSKSQWFLFLAYLRTGEDAKAKAISIDDEATYGERARAIKAELK